MASISNDGNGRKRLLVILPDGARKAIRLGKMTLRDAVKVKIKVEALVSSKIAGYAVPDDETSRWLASLDDQLLRKLAKLDLAKARGTVGLMVFLDSYIESRVDIKPLTKMNLEQARRHLLIFFDADRLLRDIEPADAEDYRLHLIKTGLADNTARRLIGRARQFFKAAIKRGLIQSNPFDGIAASVKGNPERFHYISGQDAEKIIATCPDNQWRMIFALARYGGLRCPSEVLSLKWGDIDWECSRIRVPSPKTEHLAGGAIRIIPLFPELLLHLREGFEQAEPGTTYVITRYRDTSTNMRTQLVKIIRRAGLEPWQKPFQNLRSSRETELAERFPIHVVCKWIGNTASIAARHYLQLTDEHFDRAVRDGQDEAAQNAAQQPAEQPCNGSQAEDAPSTEALENATFCEMVPVASETCDMRETPRAGLEPAT